MNGIRPCLIVALAFTAVACQDAATPSAVGAPSPATMASASPKIAACPATPKDFAPPTGQQLNDILADVEKYIVDGMAKCGTPGMAVAITQDDRVIYKKPFGVKTLGDKDPVTENTLFQIGSTSKAFTAALMAMMVDAKKYDWNDRVIDHLSDFRMYDAWVTQQFVVEDLMAQRSGLPPHAGDMISMLGFNREDIIKSLRYIQPVSSFRQQFAYQNNMFLVAARLVEKYSGKTWEQNVTERIFKPLGMSNSSMDIDSYRNSRDAATTHHMFDGKIMPIPMNWALLNWSYVYGPAGGINSNINDMCKWAIFNANNGKGDGEQLISPQNMSYLRTPKTVTDPNGANDPLQYYCQAWIYRTYAPYPIIWHNGGTIGCKTMIAFIPQTKTAIVVLSNYANTELPENIAYYFFDRYFGKTPRDYIGESLKKEQAASQEQLAAATKPSPGTVPPLPNKAYIGFYENEMYGKLVIAENYKGDMELIFGPAQIHLSLAHINGNIFQLQYPQFDGGYIMFTMGVDGSIESLTIQMLDAEKTGTFQKVPG